jgi:hypothetical protein
MDGFVGHRESVVPAVLETAVNTLGMPVIRSGNGRPHIVFLITYGFAARMMIRSGLTGRLSKEGARITVVTPNADESYFQQECQAEDITVRQQPSGAGRIALWFRVYRSYLLDDVMNNPALRSHHLRRLQSRPLLASTMGWINRTVARSPIFRSISRTFEFAINRSKKVAELLRQLRPDLLVLPNPFGPEETLYLIHAKALKIPTVCQMLSWDNITSKGTPLLMPDYFVSWGPVMTEEMVQVYGFPRGKIFECGVPHFDVYHQAEALTPRSELLKQLQLPEDRPYIFYGTVAEMYCPNELEIIQWLADRVTRDAFIKPCSLVIRPHPLSISGVYASKHEQLRRLQSLASSRVAVDFPQVLSEKLAWDLPKSDMYRLASLLAGSAMCINASSTLCLDACMLDCPVINISFDGSEELPYEKSTRRGLDYIHMTKLLALNGVRIARSFDDLKKHINAYLGNPKLDCDQRLLTATQECGPRDGKAAERVAAVLYRLCNETQKSISTATYLRKS